MGKKLTEETIKNIFILYDKYQKKTKVAEELGISTSTVAKYLNCPDSFTEKKKRTKITPEIIEKINELYSKMKNMAKVGRELGISGSTVKRYLNKENLELCKTEGDDKAALWYYVYHLFGIENESQPVSELNITLMNRFREQGMPYKGQLLTLKYFYEIKKNKVKKEYRTIGIISYIWNEACSYYERQAYRQKEFLEEIQKQLEKDRIEVKYNPEDYFKAKKAKKKRKEIDLNSIG